MSLTTTTLSSAIAATDTSLVVASATGFAAGNKIVIDGENFTVLNSYVSGTTIPVLRGQGGTVVSAHPATANVTTGLASDFANAGPQQQVTYPYAGRVRTVASYSASGAIALPTPGTDVFAIINGTNALDMTLAAPTKDMDGSFVYVCPNGAAAHTLTVAGGVGGAGTSYDKFTLAADPVLFVLAAANGAWVFPIAAAITGTVTNITAGIG